MHNPLRGVVTAEHQDHGGYRDHYGRDIGTRDPKGNWIYGVGQPVHAAFAGRASHIVRWSTRGNRASTWAPGRTGNGLRITNPDGEVQGYNHMKPVAELRNGDWVAKGQLIGHLDLSGNMTAPHLHLETWANSSPSSHFSPKLLFDKYGVSTMDNPANASTASIPATSGKDWFAMATEAQLRKIIREELKPVHTRIAGVATKVWQWKMPHPVSKKASAAWTHLVHARANITKTNNSVWTGIRRLNDIARELLKK